MLNNHPGGQRAQDIGVGRITVAMMVQVHHIDRADYPANGRFNIIPAGYTRPLHAGIIAAGKVLEGAVADRQRQAQRVLAEAPRLVQYIRGCKQGRAGLARAAPEIGIDLDIAHLKAGVCLAEQRADLGRAAGPQRLPLELAPALHLLGKGQIVQKRTLAVRVVSAQVQRIVIAGIGPIDQDADGDRMAHLGHA